jgi:formylglycine-generating enzyme required for sulfatase activity
LGDEEGPTRNIQIGQSFAVGRYELSLGEFRRFVAESGYLTEAERGDGCFGWASTDFKKDKAYNWRQPGFPQKDETEPVVCVSWNDAQAYIAWLTQRTGHRYRLLTEAEWEYVARAGRGSTRYPWGDDPAYRKICRFANGADRRTKAEIPSAVTWKTADCDDGYAYTAPGKAFLPNAFGLHNVHGNAWEWVQDCFDDKAYQSGKAPLDGSAYERAGCSLRVLRGGSWSFNPQYLRSADRNRDAPGNRDSDVGFRLARMLP